MTAGQQLEADLRAEIAALSTVFSHLEAEHQALRAGDAERIERSTQAKDRALQQLATLQQQRQAHDGSTTTASLVERIAQLDNTAVNAPLQQQLVELGERCAAMNAANGVLIGRLAEHTRSALRVLRQQDSNPRLYSGTGTPDSASDSQTLGKA